MAGTPKSTSCPFILGSAAGLWLAGGFAVSLQRPCKKLAATEGLYAHQLCPCQNVGKPRYCRSMGW